MAEAPSQSGELGAAPRSLSGEKGRVLWQRILRAFRHSAPFSSLQRRIIFFNLVGLAVLVMGVMYLNQFRSGLIEMRVEALRTEGRLMAITIAETAALGPDTPDYDPVRANLVMARLARAAGVRARLYDRRLRLTGDTHSLSPWGAAVDAAALGPPAGLGSEGLLSKLESLYRRLIASLRDQPPVYREVATAGIAGDPEIIAAAEGRISQAVRVNSEGELILSVALPVRRFEAVMGVLVLSTEGEDINTIVQAERIVILQVFIIATLVSVALSIILANTIAEPIRRLAEAADPATAGGLGALDTEHIELPDLTDRPDEIGDLSAALIRMTDALYARMEAIEAFAADVAHEIKNPLTSLRSAVETMELARTDEQRRRLVEVIKKDVERLNRLVTDISNASRLDAELVRERMAAFDLKALIRAIVEMIRGRSEERGVSIELQLPEEELRMRGLEARIGQVITNLLDNAVSFSREGARIRLGAAPDRGRKIVRITVEDEGPGIPEENLETIFERFYSERPDGEGFGDHSGLGLSISRQIVEAHGGRIWAENIRPESASPDEPPRGARFVVELPG